MSINLETFREIIRELIKKELQEASVTGNIDGGAGPPKTPHAFSKKRSKKIKKAGHEEGHKKPDVFGFTKVSEAKFHVKTDFGSVLVDAGSSGEAKMIVAKKIKGGVKAIIDVTRVAASKAKQVDKKLESVVNEGPTPAQEKQMKTIEDRIKKTYGLMKKFSGVDVKKANKHKKAHLKAQKDLNDIWDKITADARAAKKEAVTEGKYHEYRNDESLTAKQKIGQSMKEVRDKLNELDKLVKLNVKLKNELDVDPRSYWKRTHNALQKISERLVKLSNKIGQLY